MNEIPSSRCFLKQVLVSLMVKSDTVVQKHIISSQKHRGVLYQIWCSEGHNVRSDNATPLCVDVPNQRSRSTHQEGYRFQAGLPVARSVECGSHAAAPVVRAGRRRPQHLPVSVRELVTGARDVRLLTESWFIANNAGKQGWLSTYWLTCFRGIVSLHLTPTHSDRYNLPGCLSDRISCQIVFKPHISHSSAIRYVSLATVAVMTCSSDSMVNTVSEGVFA